MAKKKSTGPITGEQNPDEIFGDIGLNKLGGGETEVELPEDGSIQVAYDADGNGYYISYDPETEQYFEPYTGDVLDITALYDAEGNPFVFDFGDQAQEPETSGEYWEQFVGVEGYGYYDENQEWQWSGYFDDENNWHSNDEAELVAEEAPAEQVEPQEEQQPVYEEAPAEASYEEQQPQEEQVSYEEPAPVYEEAPAEASYEEQQPQEEQVSYEEPTPVYEEAPAEASYEEQQPQEEQLSYEEAAPVYEEAPAEASYEEQQPQEEQLSYEEAATPVYEVTPIEEYSSQEDYQEVPMEASYEEQQPVYDQTVVDSSNNEEDTISIPIQEPEQSISTQPNMVNVVPNESNTQIVNVISEPEYIPDQQPINIQPTFAKVEPMVLNAQVVESTSLTSTPTSEFVAQPIASTIPSIQQQEPNVIVKERELEVGVQYTTEVLLSIPKDVVNEVPMNSNNQNIMFDNMLKEPAVQEVKNEFVSNVYDNKLPVMQPSQILRDDYQLMNDSKYDMQVQNEPLLDKTFMYNQNQKDEPVMNKYMNIDLPLSDSDEMNQSFVSNHEVPKQSLLDDEFMARTSNKQVNNLSEDILSGETPVEITENDLFDSENYDETIKLSLSKMFDFLSKSRQKSNNTYKRISQDLKNEINSLIRNSDKLRSEYKENEHQISRKKSELIRLLSDTHLGNTFGQEANGKDFDNLQHLKDYNIHLINSIRENDQRLRVLQTNLNNVKNCYEKRMLRINNDITKIQRLVSNLNPSARSLNLLESSFNTIRRAQDHYQSILNGFDPIGYDAFNSNGNDLIPSFNSYYSRSRKNNLFDTNEFMTPTLNFNSFDDDFSKFDTTTGLFTSDFESLKPDRTSDLDSLLDDSFSTSKF